jgi:D-alanyl-D-alanine carboxypeptidase (penicillin-binding protein 5/6)
MKTPKPKTHFPTKIVGIALIVLIVIAYATAGYLSTPKVSATASQIDVPSTPTTAIVWPNYGQSAVGAEGFGVLAASGAQTAHPIASIAKLVLAESVLEKYPLTAGQAGPSITITMDDVNLYNANLAQQGSIVPVNAGEQLTEYQMLQGLLIASGDNIADTLANWAFGSVNNYLSYANKMLADMNLKVTHVADASGLSPLTVSSATELVTLGEKALKQPVIADIVSQQKVTLPFAGSINNYDSLLGQNGVVGIKTGNTPEAGGCFLFAVKDATNPVAPAVVGAILGAKNLSSVLSDSRTFIQTNIKNFKTTTVVKAGQVVGSYDAPWGEKVNVVAAKDLVSFTVTGEKISTKTSLKDLSATVQKGTEVGSVTATTAKSSESVSVVLESQQNPPTFLWKLGHPFNR